MSAMSDVKRGEEAERLLNSPVYIEAVTKVREGIISTMQGSSIGDKDLHNKLVIALQLLGGIEKNIKTIADTGKMAKIEIEQGLGSKLRKVFN